MRNRKRILSLALALVLCLGLAAPALAAADEPLINCVGATQVTNGRITYYLSEPVMAVLHPGSAAGLSNDEPVYVIPHGTQLLWYEAQYAEYFGWRFNGEDWYFTELLFDEEGVESAVQAPFEAPYAGMFTMQSYGYGAETYFFGVSDHGDRLTPTENLVIDFSQPSPVFLNNVLGQSTVTLNGQTIPLYDIPVDSGTWKDFWGVDGTFRYYKATMENGQLQIGEQLSYFDTTTSEWGASSWYGLWIDSEDVGEYFYIEYTQEASYDWWVLPTPIRFAIRCVDPNNYTPASTTAYASTQEVDVDGEKVTFECYALKDENGNLTNYIKLRDLAMILNGTLAQFQVGWDGSVTITTKSAYTPNGSEGSTPYSGDRSYSASDAVTKIDGQAADLTAFVLNDDNGGGYTYYQLRDLARLLGFNVGWDGSSIFLETDKPYDANN